MPATCSTAAVPARGRAPARARLWPQISIGVWPTSISATSSTSAAGIHCRSARINTSRTTLGKLDNAVIGGWSINWIVTAAGRPAASTSVAQPEPPPEPAATMSRSRARARTSESRRSHRRRAKTVLVGQRGGLPPALPIGEQRFPIVGTPAGCIPFTGNAFLGGSNGTDRDTGIQSSRLLGVQGHPDERTLLHAVPG